MPCIKCSNGKWKYGEKGKCIYETKKKCNDAAAAIHIEEEKENEAKHKSKYSNKKDI